MDIRLGRRRFLQSVGATAGVVASRRALAATAGQSPQAAAQPAEKQATTTGPRSFEFVFARLRYDSGDWDYNPKVASNVLDAVLQYTEIPVYQTEVVITADSAELPSFPFLFMTGHKLVRFNAKERQGLIRFVETGGLLFSDDCNHDIDGLYAKSFEAEMHRAFTGPDVLAKIPNAHPILIDRFFDFPTALRRPVTS